MMRSAIVLAGLVASVMAESPSCPLSTTITSTETRQSSVYVTVTSLDSDPLPTVTETPTSYVTTGTTTIQEPVYEETCTSTTRNVEYTSTVYTGNYTSSSLRQSTSCAPAQSFVYVYPGTTTETYTKFLYASTTTVPAVTVETQATEWVVNSASTTTVDGYCTTTIISTTATASAAATQALKCAPTNLIGTDGLSHSRSGYRGLPEDGIAWYGKAGRSPPGYDREFGTGAHKDASACCQACQEDPKCVASIWSGTRSTYPSPSVPSCDFYYGSSEDGEGDETCGLGFTVYKGDKQIAQSGSCGYIAETVFADGICPEGMTPGECDKQGFPGRFIRSGDDEY